MVHAVEFDLSPWICQTLLLQLYSIKSLTTLRLHKVLLQCKYTEYPLIEYRAIRARPIKC